MAEMRQLVQVVRHAGQCAETFHRVLRHRFLDVAVYRQFIDHLGKRLADPFALEQQFGIVLPVEIDFDGTVPFLSRRQFRTAAFLRFIAASVKMFGDSCRFLLATKSSCFPARPAVLWDTKPILAPRTHSHFGIRPTLKIRLRFHKCHCFVVRISHAASF